MTVAHSAALVLPLLALIPLSALAATVVGAGGGGERSITVSGEAEVRVVPDQVQLWLRVETSHERLATAKSNNDDRVKQTLAMLGKFGLEPKHIQTDYLTLNSEWNDYARKSDSPSTYQVSRSVVVTLTDLKRFEELVSAVVEAGANVVEGIQFATTQLRQHRDRARALALQAAREKGAAMAAELGMKVGKPRTITESSGGFGYGWRGPSSRGMSQVQNVMQNAGGGGELSEEGFAPGQISVHASVQVTFDME